MNSNVRYPEMLSRTEAYVQEFFQADGSGHDWWHIHRVRTLALKLAELEGGDRFIVEMAALLHDLDDWKLNGNNVTGKVRRWLNSLELDATSSEKILNAIDEVSFKGAGVETHATSIEAQIVQDADRLDAIGAIGIGRTFAYGGHKGRLMYDPGIPPEMHLNFEDYKKTTAPTINHFYEKLLLLKGRMNTATAKSLAEERHRFMEDFLDRFFREWTAEI